MDYRVWIVKIPEGWVPTAWTDKPPEAVAVTRLDTPPLELGQANDCAQGFNQREMENRLGVWMLVCKIGREPAKGNKITIVSGDVEILNP